MRKSVTDFVREHRNLILIVSIGFVLRLAWLLHAHPEPVSDYQVYRELATTLLDEGRFGVHASSSLNLPGYPSLLAGLMLISRSVGFLSFVMVLMSTAACLLAYLLAARLGADQTIALVAAAVCALNPTFIVYSPLLATEHLFALLILAALLLALRLHEAGNGIALAVGLLVGAATLTRGETIFYLPVFAGVIWFLGDRIPLRQKVRTAGLLLAGLAVVTVPWMVRNAVVVEPGVTLSTAGGMNFYFAHNPNQYGWHEDVPWPREDDVTANRVGWELGFEHLRNEPLSVLESTRDGTFALYGSPEYALFWSSQVPNPGGHPDFTPRFVRFEGVVGRVLVTGAALLLSLTAVSFLGWRAWTRPMRVVISTLLACNWLGYAVVFFGHPRFRYTAEMFMAILAAFTIVTLRRATRGPREGRAE